MNDAELQLAVSSSFKYNFYVSMIPQKYGVMGGDI